MPNTAVDASSFTNEPPSSVAVPVSVPRIGMPMLATARVISASSPRRMRTPMRPMIAPPGTVTSGSRT